MTADRPQRPSKTSLKRQMHELQALGEALIDLPDAELAAIDVPEPLLEAIRDARRTTKRGAARRQRQYIGRLMRDIDPAPIREALASRAEQARRAGARFKALERWRERLLTGGEPALAQLLTEYPAADRRALQDLVRLAGEERRNGATPTAARRLFRYLDGLMD